MCPLILCSHMKVPLSLLSVAVALLCAACAFGQTVAYQFKAGDFTATTDSATWAAAGGGSVMTSVHSATNGWSLAVKEGGAVCFDNGVSSPLGFPDSATNTVAYAFAVVECSEPSNHATLIDAPLLHPIHSQSLRRQRNPLLRKTDQPRRGIVHQTARKPTSLRRRHCHNWSRWRSIRPAH